ncbi:MAG: hypothetical protein E6J17_04770, partial [Chloroflexi bacterium]
MSRASTVAQVGAMFVVALIAWKALVVIGGYPVFILPPPDTVANRFVRAWIDGTFAPHFGA